MAIIATPSRRQLAMAALLALAIAGALIRHYAANPSTLRDIGTLLLVMWLPAVGNLIAYLVRRLPRRAPAAPASFAADLPFTPHLRVELNAVHVPAQLKVGLDPQQRQCTLVVGQQGFNARLALPVLEAISGDHPADREGTALELLRPEAGLAHLPAGTRVSPAVRQHRRRQGPRAAGAGAALARCPHLRLH